MVILGLYRDNGKENGNYYYGFSRGYYVQGVGVVRLWFLQLVSGLLVLKCSDLVLGISRFAVCG